jgi:peptidoglycan/LPS O-acetylase OafA/YrhL
MRERRYDVDWLRVLAMLVVFYFHNAMFFNDSWWHLKNRQLSFGMSVFTAFVGSWMMPLFFIVSGFGTGFSLRFRTAGQYALERLKRLFIPLVFGTLVLIAPQVYYERIYNGQFHGSYFQFYPHFFQGIYPDGNFSYHHLWFLLYLFAFSLIALPLFLHFKTQAGQRLVSRFASVCQKPGGIFLLALPIAAIEVALRPKFPGWQTLISDWANFLTYLTLFTYGYLFASEPVFARAIEKHWKAALALALCCTGALAFILIRYDPDRGYTLAYSLTTVLQTFTSWFWLVTFLGAAQRYLSLSNRFLQYANETVLPFYIFHQTVIIAIGFYVIQWHMGIMPKYLIISTASLLITVALCDLIVKRTNPTRFLFGMRPLTREQSQK